MESNSYLKYPLKKYAYVVEGKTDEDKLKKLGCQYIITTNGKYIRKEIINFLKEVKAKRDLILVLDPDGPGKQIEDILNSKLGLSCSISINKKDAISIKKSKVGIAETNSDVLKDIMKAFILHDINTDEMPSLDEDDLIDYLYKGSKTAINKKKIIETYKIPYKTFKNIYECLLMLDVSKKELEDLLDE